MTIKFLDTLDFDNNTVNNFPGGGGGGGASTLLVGLAAWWKLDEVGGDRGDSSGNGWTLTDVNTVTSQAGLIGNEAVFVSANSEKLFIPTTEDAQPFREDQSFSFSTWVTFDSLAATQTLGSVYEISGDQRKWLLQFNFGAGALSFLTSNDGTFASADTLATTGWSGVTSTRYHVVVTYDVVTNAKAIYVDGVLDNSNTASHSAGSHRSTDSIVLGAQRAGVSTDFLDGKLDETAYWSRPLTADEVSELYNSGSGITIEDLASGTGGGSGGGSSETVFSKVKLAEVEITASGTDTITFDNIDQTYKNLVIEYKVRNDLAAGGIQTLYMVVNDDTTNTNYIRDHDYSFNGVASAFKNTTTAEARGIGYITRNNAAANFFSYGTIAIQNYTDTDTVKIFRGETDGLFDTDGTIPGNRMIVWENTAAVTKLVFDMNASGDDFLTGSKFTLYGEKELTVGGSGGGGGSSITLIDEYIGDGTADNFTFSAIPGTYKEIYIEFSCRSTGAFTDEPLKMYFNGDTTDVNYMSQELRNINIAIGASDFTGGIIASIPGTVALANSYSSGKILIPNYNGTANLKHAQCWSSYFVAASNVHQEWRDLFSDSISAAITDIRIQTTTASNNFDNNTYFRLYGVTV